MKYNIKYCIGVRSAIAFAWFLFLRYLPLYFLGLGLSGFEIGILLSLLTLMSIAFSIPFGGLSDIFSVKRLIQFGIAGSAAFVIGLKFSPSFIVLLPVFVLGGIACELDHVASRSYLLKSLSSGSEKGEEMGAFTCGVAYACGGGALVGGALLTFAGFDILFIICAVVMAMTLPVAFAMPEAPGKVAESFNLRGVASKLKERRLLALLLAMALFSFHIGAEQTCFVPFLRKEIGIGMTEIGTILAIGGFILGTSALLGGRYEDKAGSLKLVVVCLGISALGNVAFAFSGNFFLAALTRTVHVIGDGIFIVASWLALAEPFRTIEKGRAGGFGGFGSIVGMGSGAMISGALSDYLGFSFPFIAAAGLEGVAALILILAAGAQVPFIRS